MKRTLNKIVLFSLTIALLLCCGFPALADGPSPCTQCILGIRPDILPFYEQNGWDISPENHNNIIDNWCGIDPVGCCAAKFDCRAKCELCDPPNICTQCILDIRPDILPFYEQNGWDISPENQDNIIDNWCGIDPVGCGEARSNCDADCDPDDGEIPRAEKWDFPVGNSTSCDGWWVALGLGQDNGNLKGHLGEDWNRWGGSSDEGEPVRAAANGRVHTVDTGPGSWLDVVIIEHVVPGISEHIYSFYGHLLKYNDAHNNYVSEGEDVSKGQQIGTIGSFADRGYTLSPHLHFEIKNQTALDNEFGIGGGYSGKSNDYNCEEDYYDPSDGIDGNRYYHPTRFIESRKVGGPSCGPDKSSFVKDLTLPDGVVICSDQQTRWKGWRLKNTCFNRPWIWSTTEGYRAVRISHENWPESPEDFVPFPSPQGSLEPLTVCPGQEGDLYVELDVLPSAEGTYKATYKLEGPSGTFGTEFWVKIVVVDCGGSPSGPDIYLPTK